MSSEYRLIDLLDGGKGLALGKVAEAEGIDCDLDAFFQKDVYVNLDFNPIEDMDAVDGTIGEINLKLNVDAGANAGTDAIYGGDRLLFNKIRAYGWFNDVIEE